MTEKEIHSMLENGVPNIPTRTDQKKAVEYVGLVYTGIDKVNAYKEVFPERYKKIYDRARADRRDVRATCMYHINQYENGKYVSSLYNVANKNYYAQFVDKRTNLLNELYDIAMDKEGEMKNRLIASKTFLSSIPEPDKVVKHEVEVDVKDTFRAKLAERQKALYSIANKEEDILDVEVE
jgi:hypothetical protein